MKNFGCTEEGQALTASAVSSRTLLTGTNAPFATDVLIDNPGPLDVYVRAGGSTVVATALSRRVPAGAILVFDKGDAQYLALLSPQGAQAVVVAVSQGA